MPVEGSVADSENPSTTLRAVPLPRIAGCNRGGLPLRRHRRRGDLRFPVELQLEQAAGRRLAAAGAVMRDDHSGRAEAELLEHPAGGGIVEEVAGVEPLQAQAVARGGDRPPGPPRWRSRGPSGGGRSNSRARSRRSGRRPKPIAPISSGAPSVRRKMSSDGSDGLALGREQGLGVPGPVGPGRGGEVADDALVGDRLGTGRGRPRSSRAAAAVSRFSRTSSLLPSSAPAVARCGVTVRRQFRGRHEKRREARRLLSLESVL